MICEKCGAKLPAHTRFCTGCGASLSSQVPNSATVAGETPLGDKGSPRPSGTSAAPNVKGWRVTGWLVAVVAVVLIVCVGIGIYNAPGNRRARALKLTLQGDFLNSLLQIEGVTGTAADTLRQYCQYQLCLQQKVTGAEDLYAMREETQLYWQRIEANRAHLDNRLYEMAQNNQTALNTAAGLADLLEPIRQDALTLLREADYYEELAVSGRTFTKHEEYARLDEYSMTHERMAANLEAITGQAPEMNFKKNEDGSLFQDENGHLVDLNLPEGEERIAYDFVKLLDADRDLREYMLEDFGDDGFSDYEQLHYTKEPVWLNIQISLFRMNSEEDVAPGVKELETHICRKFSDTLRFTQE